MQRPVATIASALERVPGVPVAPVDRYNITVSPVYGFVWFRVAKAGTRSVLAALDAAGAAAAGRHLDGVVLPAWALAGYDAWVVVRDPVERLESCWRDKAVDSNRWGLTDRERTPGGFVDWVARQDLRRADRHLRLQTSLVDLARSPQVGRVESFAADLARIFGSLDLPLRAVPDENRTRRSTVPRWSPAVRSRAREIYAGDCEAFGY